MDIGKCECRIELRPHISACVVHRVDLNCFEIVKCTYCLTLADRVEELEAELGRASAMIRRFVDLWTGNAGNAGAVNLDQLEVLVDEADDYLEKSTLTKGGPQI